MAIKKSELYSSLWASCDLLRGGMDASQYKDYVLVLLFIKYVSDKYAGQPYAAIQVPEGASFKDLVALKGKPDIGDQINKKIIEPLRQANQLSDMPDFNKAELLGTGKEMVDRLSDLIAVFEKPELDFSANRAEGDDILGDAYEYLMRHFATESGKSKGQFYTPAEVSRIMAQIIGIGDGTADNNTTVYDPTCGSGSLLLKVGDVAHAKVTLYGQEKDAATSGLARMNMILHDNATALIKQGNTLADPKFKDGDSLKTFDFVVANPPFSDKRWSTGLDPEHDPYGRFDTFGIPPAKQGDYAYLLHIVRSLKSTGKGACILPHGVLFRGNAEAEIRRNLIRHGYLKGIIGLPANLFYGTGIPACIVVVDKENSQARRGVFMVDASQGFIKDGPKNRLREQDIHRIVDAFNRQDESEPRFARLVGFDEIERNDFNLNLPRYIDSTQAEDVQDIAGHLEGGIPVADVKALSAYWAVCPDLKAALFRPQRDGYMDLAVDKAAIKSTIYAHPQFAAFLVQMGEHFTAWRSRVAPKLKALPPKFHPKQLGTELSDNLLAHYQGQPLIDPYDVYQHFMDYWAETMQDDAYLISADGWKAETYRVIETDKKGKQKDKGWACDLVPKQFVIAQYFAAEQKAIDEAGSALEAATGALAELEEEHSGEDGLLASLDKINAAAVKARIKEIGKSKDDAEELAVLRQWQDLAETEAELKKLLKAQELTLDKLAYEKYPKLSADEIRSLVVDDKWLAALSLAVHGEVQRVSQALTQRVRELAERYEAPLPVLTAQIADLEAKVVGHLANMGFAIKQGAIQELLTGTRRLPGFGGEWVVKSLGDVAHIKTGSRNNEDKVKDGEYPFFVRSEFVERINSYSHDCEAILVPGEGRIGEIFHYINGRFDVHQRVYAITQFAQDVSGRFVHLYMKANFGPWAMQNTVKATVDSLRLPTFQNFQMRLPPTKEEQTAIAEVVGDMDAHIAALEAKREKTAGLRQGVMQELLTGKTRLPAR